MWDSTEGGRVCPLCAGIRIGKTLLGEWDVKSLIWGGSTWIHMGSICGNLGLAGGEDLIRDAIGAWVWSFLRDRQRSFGLWGMDH